MYTGLYTKLSIRRTQRSDLEN